MSATQKSIENRVFSLVPLAPADGEMEEDEEEEEGEDEGAWGGGSGEEEGNGYEDYYLQYDDEDFAVSCLANLDFELGGLGLGLYALGE